MTEPAYSDEFLTVIEGDCLDVMASMEPNSVDTVITDPPYGLEFMGKEWDALGKSGVQRKAEGGGGDRRAIVDADEWAGGVSSPFSRSRVRWQHGAAGPARAILSQLAVLNKRLPCPHTYLHLCYDLGQPRLRKQIVVANTSFPTPPWSPYSHLPYRGRGPTLINPVCCYSYSVREA